RYTMEQQMGQPYRRIVILHVGIIAAFVPVLLLQSPLPLLIAIILMKIGLDVYLHVRAHRRLRKKGGEDEAPDDAG
ncbi:MAG TPA: DUF6498-containing protein, partial [Planctomycetota bacterium]|nr:DUF6498-containing protein [Planctomycetota bacterium]